MLACSKMHVFAQATARKVGDELLEMQLGFVQRALKLGSGLAGLLDWEFAGNGSREKLKLTTDSLDGLKLVVERLQDVGCFLQSQVPGDIKHESPDWVASCNSIFKSHRPTALVHVEVFDKFVVGTIYAQLAKLVDERRNVIVAGWRSDVDLLSKTINDSIPKGWLEKKDSILDASAVKERKALLNNSGYVRLGELGKCLDTIGGTCKKETAFDILDKSRIAEAEDLCHHATTTVACTFALFHICVQWPKIQGAGAKVASAEKLAKELQERKVWRFLPKALANHIQAFGKSG